MCHNECTPILYFFLCVMMCALIYYISFYVSWCVHSYTISSRSWWVHSCALLCVMMSALLYYISFYVSWWLQSYTIFPSMYHGDCTPILYFLLCIMMTALLYYISFYVSWWLHSYTIFPSMYHDDCTPIFSLRPCVLVLMMTSLLYYLFFDCVYLQLFGTFWKGVGWTCGRCDHWWSRKWHRQVFPWILFVVASCWTQRWPSHSVTWLAPSRTTCDSANTNIFSSLALDQFKCFKRLKCCYLFSLIITIF